MDKIFLIGHRGVGKTSLVANFKKKHPHYQCYDLDEVVESDHGRTIVDYFEKHEESLFRQKEIESLQTLCKERGPYVVALGAGFKLDKFQFPSESLVLWVRRCTDSSGRVFLNFDRPALTQASDALEEWQQKFQEREELYSKVAQAQVIIPESVDHGLDYLGRYLLDRIQVPESFYCTMLPKENVLACMSGSFGIELRNDIWSELDIHKILKQLPLQRKIILAIRKLNFLTLDFIKNLDRFKYPNLKVDWDIVLAQQIQELPNIKAGDIISEHRKTIEDLQKWKQAYQGVFIYKFSPETKDLSETLDLYQTFKTKFRLCSFLPRSAVWDSSWLRMVLSPYNELNFFRFSQGSASEQPLWFDLGRDQPQGFYGILGESVQHSFTPDMHRSLFVDKAVYPVRISLPESEINLDLIERLSQWKVKFLAVTSPYKTQMHDLMQELAKLETVSFDSNNFKSLNTLYLDSHNKAATNTDYEGLKEFLKNHLNPKWPVVVLGGGGLLEMLQALLPEAFFIAARTLDLRVYPGSRTLEEFKALTEAQVVWAAGEKSEWPQWKFHTRKVLDLDYKMSSKAKRWVYLLNHKSGDNTDYVSGFDFFKTQGLAQQQFWSQYDI